MKRLLVLIVLLFLGVVPVRAWAVLATLPGQMTNNIALLMQYGQQIEQFSKQLDQYALQLQQYQDQVTNTVAPAAYIWDQAQQTMSKLSWAINVVRNYENSSGGGLEGYLQQFEDPSYYTGSPCFKAGGCTEAQLKTLQKESQSGTYSELLSNYSLVQSIYQAQDQITQDAGTLTKLQKNAQDAKGRMAAIEAGNELASEQAEQLLEIRTLMVQQENAQATQRLRNQNTENLKDAGDAAVTAGSPPPDDTKTFSFLPAPPQSTY